MSLNLEVRLWKRCASEGRRCSGATNIIASSRTNYHSSMSGASSSIPPRNRMMRSLLPFSSSSSFRGAASFVESTAIVKAMELLGRFRWILVFILLTDGVIGHASDGGGMNRNSGPNTSSSSPSSASSISSSTPSLSINPVVAAPIVAASISGGVGGGGGVGSSSSSNVNSNSNLVAGEGSSSSVVVGGGGGGGLGMAQAGDRDLGTIITGPPSTAADLAQAAASTESPLTPTSHHNTLQQQSLQPTRKNYPYIDKAASPNVTALLGKTAYLNCRVRNLGDKTVSWVRHRDIHLLTVARYTYTTDQRFRAIHQPNTEDYTLMIKYAQHRDSGIYECQVSTTPHLSHYVHLNVVEPVTEVVGGPDLFIDRGSTINLTCTVKFSPEPPSYIIWNHNNAIISYNSPRGGVSVLTEKGETTTSYLLIQQAKPTDSGRYSCNPSNAVPHSILVHVLNGELPAAMQTGGQMPQQIPLSFCLLSSVILIFVTS